MFPRPSIPRALVTRLALLCALMVGVAMGWTGCAGYRVGPTNGMSAGSRTVQVNFFQNLTLEPRLMEALNTALRRRFQADGTYRLVTDGTGDIVLSGAISKYERSGLSFVPGDILTARDFQIAMIAQVTAVERGTGRKLIDHKDVLGRTTVRVGNDLTSAERQAISLLAEDLARHIAELLVDGEL